jgi:hypothetical protein
VDTSLESVVSSGRAWLRKGLPTSLIALAALIVAVSILVEANSRDTHTALFAEFTATNQACVLDPTRSHGISACFRAGRGVYLLTTRRPLTGSTAVVSRGSCCPGGATASITAPQTITVALKHVRGPVHAQVVVP